MAKLLSRTEVLGNLRGRHTKQASTLLTLIENRTAYQLAESQQAAAGYPPATTSHAKGARALASRRSVISNATPPHGQSLRRRVLPCALLWLTCLAQIIVLRGG